MINAVHLGGTINNKHANQKVEDQKHGPTFTHPENIRDAKMRRPDDSDYDPSTIHIPESDWKKLSDG